MTKLNIEHTWKHVLLMLFVFLLGIIVGKKLVSGKGAYFHMKLGGKDVESSRLIHKGDYEQRLKVVEEKVKLLEEPATE